MTQAMTAFTIGTQDARNSPRLLTTLQLIAIADSAPRKGPQL
jgi:hypothetical protein